jgi:serine-type D-Ala-D-Ala carboxypeptidase/endopeptidase (penicillin-binding protein 4)
LRVINKVSQNLHAELALRLLGKEKGTSGSIEGGLEVTRGFLTNAGIRPEQFAFYDGSGLSRENLVSPAAIVQLLQYAYRQPWGQLFTDTLPVSGLDGSLAERLKTPPAKGAVHAKTGSLNHVNALSGYATTVTGETVAFSILCNNHNLANKKALETIDRIVEKIVTGGN